MEEKIIGFLLCGHDGIRGFIYHVAVYDKYEIRKISKMMIERSLLELIQVIYLLKVVILIWKNFGTPLDGQ